MKSAFFSVTSTSPREAGLTEKPQGRLDKINVHIQLFVEIFNYLKQIIEYLALKYLTAKEFGQVIQLLNNL